MKPATRHARRISRLVLVLIDVIHHFEFPDGQIILRQALTVRPALARMKKRAREGGIPARRRAGPSSNNSGPTTRITSS